MKKYFIIDLSLRAFKNATSSSEQMVYDRETLEITCYIAFDCNAASLNIYEKYCRMKLGIWNAIEKSCVGAA